MAQRAVVLDADVKTVWKVLTNLEDQGWRRDTESVAVVNPHEFIEHAVGDYTTVFIITAFESPSCYEFDMNSPTLSGHWTGLFASTGNQTRLTLIEDVTTKKWFMRPFVRSYLTKQVTDFAEDLRTELSARSQETR